MNKYQEVLDKVKDDIEFAYERLFGIKPLPKSREQELNLLQELVDKATPKKPYFINYGGFKIGNWHCGNCDGIINDGDRYCKHCGHLQDLGEENDT